jgi:repressor LexA
MQNLTARQREVYEFIRTYLQEYATAPSYEEIRAALGLRSLATVSKHLKQLERKGWLSSPWGSEKRALSLTALGGRALAVPLLGQVAAGIPIEALEAPEDVEVPESLLRGGDCFALRVRGDSMVDDGIRDNDLILVKSQQTAENGQTVVALIDGQDATVKKFYRQGNMIELRPANETMQPLTLPSSRVRIRGVVVGLMRSYK